MAHGCLIYRCFTDAEAGGTPALLQLQYSDARDPRLLSWLRGSLHALTASSACASLAGPSMFVASISTDVQLRDSNVFKYVHVRGPRPNPWTDGHVTSAHEQQNWVARGGADGHAMVTQERQNLRWLGD